MKNEVVLGFVIADFDDITHAKITERLNIDPIKVYVKGQKTNPKFSALSKRNRWIMGSGLDRYTSFSEQLTALLDIIEPKMELFRPLCDKYYCMFSCAIFIYYDNDESTPSVHLDERYNQLIKQLNIEFDFDLYCLPDDDG